MEKRNIQKTDKQNKILKHRSGSLSRWFTLLLVLTILFTSTPFTQNVMGEQTGDQMGEQTGDHIPPLTYHDIDYGFEEESPSYYAKDQIGTYSIQADGETGTAQSENVTIPESYRSDQVHVDGDIKNYLPPFRNQNPYGTCWAFSALGACESGLIRKGISDNTVDLSERQLAYYFYFKGADTTDPLNGTKGDYNKLCNSDDDYLELGGNNLLTIWHLASWCGPVAESEVPYKGFLNNRYADINGLMGMPNSTEMAYQKDAFHLQNAYVISIGNSYQDVEQRKTMQKLIMEYGALGISYYSNAYSWEDYKYESLEHDSYYNDTYSSTNHAVNVVGWDDSFSKENFATQPDGDGAWLIRNSWGEESDTKAQNGYFWLSYYDHSLRDYKNSSGSNVNKYAFVYDCEAADNYDNIYQYDGDAGFRGPGYSVYKAANVYKAIANSGNGELLRAVGIGCSTPGTEYTLKIYKDLTDESNPESGTEVSQQTGYLPYNGYQTINLNEPLDLPYGTTYSVVFCFKKLTSLYASRTFDNKPLWSFVATSNQKQSFLSLISKEHGQGWLDAANNQTTYPCALRIKAYTDNLSKDLELSNYDIVFDKIGDSKVISVNSISANTLSDNSVSDNDTEPSIVWNSSDESVVKLERPEGHEHDSRYIKVVSVGNGKCLVTAKRENEKVSCMVTVSDESGKADPTEPETPDPNNPNTPEPTDPNKPNPNDPVTPGPTRPDTPGGADPDLPNTPQVPEAVLSGLKMNKDTVTLENGKQISLSATPIYSTNNITKEWMVYWKSSDNTVATVNSYGEVTAKKPGLAKITIFNGEIQDSCLVTVKPKKVTLSSVTLIANQKAKVQWKMTEAKGYVIYRATSVNGNYKKIKEIKNQKDSLLTLQALNNSKAYYYKIRAYSVINGKRVYGSYSEPKSVAPKSPVFTTAKALGGKKIRLNWKKTTNASGYDIYRASKIDGSYKKIKTITSSKTVSYTNKSLVRGKTYYYKIRAYRVINGKKVYGSYSNIMNAKCK